MRLPSFLPSLNPAPSQFLVPERPQTGAVLFLPPHLMCVRRYNYGDLTTKWMVGDAKTALVECDHQERYLSSALNDPAEGAEKGPPTEYSASSTEDSNRGWRDHSAAKHGKHLHVGQVKIRAGEPCVGARNDAVREEL